MYIVCTYIVVYSFLHASTVVSQERRESKRAETESLDDRGLDSMPKSR